MDLFDMANEIEKEGLSSITDLFKSVKTPKFDISKLNLIEPKLWKYIVFSSNSERKIALKNYKFLGKKDNFQYKYTIDNINSAIDCNIIGYIDCKNDVDHDHLVISIQNKLHVILTEYFVEMQKK